MNETLYDRIRRLRQESGMTQTDLAKALGYVDKSIISKIESGKIDITAKKIMELASVLCTTPRYLMDGDDPECSFSVKHPSQASDSDETRLLTAYRAADPVYKAVALELLESHPLVKGKADAG